MLKLNTSEPEHNGFIETWSRLTSDLDLWIYKQTYKYTILNEEILQSYILICIDISPPLF